MFVVEFLIEVVFQSLSGWLGHVFVKFITFGKAKLRYDDSSKEDLLASIIGVILLVGIVIGSVFALRLMLN